MRVSGISHVAIFTPWLQSTKKFYQTLLGMHEVPRPDFGFSGAWLAPDGSEQAIIHLYGEMFPADWCAPSETLWKTGHVAHVSLDMEGIVPLIARCEGERVPWTYHAIAGTPLGQVFLFDPNGVLLECTFRDEDKPNSQILSKNAFEWERSFAEGGLIAFDGQAYSRWRIE